VKKGAKYEKEDRAGKPNFGLILESDKVLQPRRIDRAGDQKYAAHIVVCHSGRQNMQHNYR